MAREIIVLEQKPSTNRESGFVQCIFVYPSEFIRLGTPYPITPLTELDAQTLAVFTSAEQLLIDKGELSFELIGILNVPKGSTDAERNQRLRRKYRVAKDTFTELIVDPKSFDVEYIGVPA